MINTYRLLTACGLLTVVAGCREADAHKRISVSDGAIINKIEIDAIKSELDAAVLNRLNVKLEV